MRLPLADGAHEEKDDIAQAETGQHDMFLFFFLLLGFDGPDHKPGKQEPGDDGQDL